MDDEIDKEILALQSLRSPGDPPLLENVPLKIPPKYGVFRWWPNDQNWVHPDDLATARELIPSERIFRREDYDREYFLFTYGQQYLRARPVIWLEVKTEGYELGDQIEITSRVGKGHPMMATITGIHWDKQRGRILYTIFGNETRLPRAFSSEEFQLAHQIGTHLDERKLKLLQRARFG